MLLKFPTNGRRYRGANICFKWHRRSILRRLLFCTHKSIGEQRGYIYLPCDLVRIQHNVAILKTI